MFQTRVLLFEFFESFVGLHAVVLIAPAKNVCSQVSSFCTSDAMVASMASDARILAMILPGVCRFVFMPENLLAGTWRLETLTTDGSSCSKQNASLARGECRFDDTLISYS